MSPFDGCPLPEAPPASAPEDAKPFTLPHFVAWLRTRDPAEEYEISSIKDCLICRYGKAHGVEPDLNGNYFTQTQEKFDGVAGGDVSCIAYGGRGSGTWRLRDARARAGWMGR